VSFVSVTQQFNTTSSMGRLTLNVLLSFAQFEREVTSERIRDKIAASKRKGLWVGGPLPLGYHMKDDKLAVTMVIPSHAYLRSPSRRLCSPGRGLCFGDLSNILRETKFDIRARLKSVIEGFAGSRL
jgi:hypothetical protein